MEAYIIIGDANTRKSSLVRSLTGCFNRSKRDLMLGSGNSMRIYARVSSLQESETTTQEFIDEVIATGQKSVIFCLWPHSNPKDATRYPDAHDYIEAFQNAGWEVRGIAVLGGASFINPEVNTASFPESRFQPINVTAEMVREHFGWQVTDPSRKALPKTRIKVAIRH